MTNEEIKVYLQYTKVLLAIHKIKDKHVDEALDCAIEAFDEENENTRQSADDYRCICGGIHYRHSDYLYDKRMAL